jgi:ParB/RepB/Spo0J family partition protein
MVKKSVEKNSRVKAAIEVQRSEMPVFDIPIALIDVNPGNPNEMTAAQFNMLAEDAEDEYTDPVLVRKKEDGRYELIDGEHRFKALKLLNAETVPAVVTKKDMTGSTATRRMVRKNMIKGKINSDKLARLVMQEMEATGATLEDLTEDLGFESQDALEKAIRWAKRQLPNQVMQDELEKHKKQIKTMDDLAKILNQLFTKYGDTLPSGFMILDFGGKDHLWVRMERNHLKRAQEMAAKCQELGLSMSSAVVNILDSVKWEEFLMANSAFIEKATEGELAIGEVTSLDDLMP